MFKFQMQIVYFRFCISIDAHQFENHYNQRQLNDLSCVENHSEFLEKHSVYHPDTIKC